MYYQSIEVDIYFRIRSSISSGAQKEKTSKALGI
jgi:hypothetical protein